MQCPVCRGSGEIDSSAAHAGMLILAARNAAGLTQDDVASKVGRSRAQIANIEGGRSSFDVKMLRKFADALGVQPKDLIP